MRTDRQVERDMATGMGFVLGGGIIIMILPWPQFLCGVIPVALGMYLLMK